MMRIIYILALFGVIIGTSANISHPPHWGWLFNVRDKPVTEASKDERSLCDSNQCKILGKILKQSMNEAVDPCEDFYEYACGNWAVHNPRPKDEDHWNLLYKTQNIVDKRLLDILNGDSSESLFSVRLAKRAYKACMDTDAIESRGVQPILSTLWRIGGWPLIMEENEWAEEIYKWKIVDDYYANLIGLTSLYDIKMGELDWSSDTMSLLIDTPHLPYKLYRFLKPDDILEPDSSDEDNESPEGSQERGSKERRRSKEEKSDENDESDNEEGEGEEELPEKRLAKKGNNRRLGFGKRKHNKINGIKKHVRKHNMKRIKRTILKAHNHKMRQHKQKKVTSHSTHHATKKGKRVSSQRHVNGPVRQNNSRNQRRKEDTNDDIYFHNENEGEIDLKKVNNKKAKDYNDEEDTDTESKGNGSGNGDDDTEWQHGNDSGSGDDENDSGSGDEENEGDEEDEDYMEESSKKAEELRKQYVEYMLNVSSALAQARGVPIPKEKLVEGVNELMEFQVELLKLIVNCEEPMNATLREFQKSYDALNNTAKTRINWVRSVQDLFALGAIEIDEDEIVGIISFEYVKAIRKLLEETPSRIIVNYIHWNFVSRVLKATTKEMTDLYYEWMGNKPDNGRSAECIDEIEAKYCLGYEYVKRYFSDDILQTASDMIDDIQKEVEYQVKEATWMDDDTRDFVLDKLVYLKKILGYPAAYRNATAMRQLMRGLSVSPSHYENKLGIMRHAKRENLRFYGKEGLKMEQFIDPLLVNAFFMFSENTIEITAADFQSPLFDSRQPWYINFGIIGFIISHEVNHGFDDTGRMFDKEGNYVEWLSAMAEAYEERADCFEDQYTRYSVIEHRTGNMSIKDYGKQTIGENIADSMGLQAVYRAYQRRQRECKKPDPMLPGLQDFSNDQIFFISNAYIWCEDVTQEALMKKLSQDSHSLGPLRVIGSVSNSEDFAKAFNCPVGSPMNPKKKCNIWK